MKTILAVENKEEWAKNLALCESWDVYHTADYAMLETTPGQTAYLFFHSDGDKHGALPFIVRQLKEIPWCNEDGFDAISAYGYPGPICNSAARQSPEFLREFSSCLRDALIGLNVASLFVRLHPILSEPTMLGDAVEFVGPTVFLDLTLPEDEQRRQTRKTHRNELRRLQRAGVSIVEDRDFLRLEEFIGLYDSRMHALGAANSYFFSKDYYAGLCSLPNDAVKLVHAVEGDDIVASAFFLISPDGIQYHLSATRSDYVRFSPARIVIEHMRDWGIRNSRKWIHLGGGVGSREDSLFFFKSGFSKLRAEFHVAKIVPDASKYERLCMERERVAPRSSDTADSEFFPAYRAR